MKPKLSVVIPVFNRSVELRRALRALVDQTWKDFEVVVCDDGSTEDVRAVANEVEADLRLKFVRICNSGGPARPRNTGVAKADGEWIAFLDSDDWWDPDRLRRVVCHLGDDCDLLYHRLRVATAPNIRGTRERRRTIGEPWRTDPLRHMMLRGNPIPNSAAVVRKALLDSIGGLSEDPNLVALEDFDTWLRLVERGVRPRFLDETLGSYWIGEDGISTVSERHILRQQVLFDRHASGLPASLKAQAESRQHYVLGTMLLHIPGRRRDAREHLLRAKNLHPWAQVKRWMKIVRTLYA